MRLDEHMNFMDILQNPTKHMSQVEKRRKKLGEIGIEVGDIEAMPVEDSDTNLQPIKKPPKEIDANDTFPKYNFKVISDFRTCSISRLEFNCGWTTKLEKVSRLGQATTKENERFDHETSPR